ncbi:MULTISPECIES: hypothetical protein [Kitasatospora]|uniref:Uncharacterized protein n=1 Tax=Kitasatospora setae (strain ATCC 33774 / DSM 43861 / JCM 3304 / KCC A-0304 / NBRC 14216 / KM-6054) TaxID=452652 RepID=E4MZJ1_KITSK|nr:MULTISPECIES: hypothetical protein [Kitasatospora]BAJ29765.1 hypothetical protein KSE_39690 [Kitasatospora setae KM-6054]
MSVHLPGELAALRALLDEWTGRTEDLRVVIGEDRGLDHGRLCWDALEPDGTVHPLAACRCRRRHHGPASARDLHERLKVRVPAADAADWMAFTLGQNLVYGSLSAVREARVLAGPLAELLGPDADWRANGHAAHPPPAGRNASWSPVTVWTFDAALVGIGNGYTVVAVSTGED